jgi:hypothetical protein
MPEGVCNIEISETAGKEERQFFCLCRVEDANPAKSKELDILIQQQSNFMLKKLKHQLEELPPSEDQGIKRKRGKRKQQIRLVHEKRMYDKIKIATGKIKPISTPKVEVPIGDNIITVTDPDEIAEAVKIFNVIHFAQANGSLLTASEYQDIWNLEQFNNIDINLHLIVWKLREMIRQKIEIGIEEWKHKFKFWRESTCTLPSGVHLVHFKALTETIYVFNDTQLVPDLEITKCSKRFLIYIYV